MNDEAIASFAATHRGPVIGRDHPDYNVARALHNAMIDKHPLVIARCVDAADVIAAVNFGRDSGLPIAVRGGGHSGPGLGSVEGGLVIDMSLMKGVRVDPAARTARTGGGCVTGEVDHATHTFGLAVPFGVVSTTGVAGLTLGGGHGYLSRQYGLTVDNLLAADVVLADGRFVTASETENEDLFWALRGGGGNFGVVTSFLFRSHPVDMVYGGPIVFAFDDAAAVMRWYRNFISRAPEAFYIFLGLQSVPPSHPFPQEHLVEAGLCAGHLAQWVDGRGHQRCRCDSCRTAETDHRLGPAPAFPGTANDVRSPHAGGAAVLLERRFYPGAVG